MTDTTIKSDWFDELISDLSPIVPNCPQAKKQELGTKTETETLMDKGFGDLVPNVPNVPSKKEESTKKLTHWQVETIKKWLVDIGEPAGEHYLVLNKCRVNPEAAEYFLRLANERATEKRRQKVLAMLAENPSAERSYFTDTEADPDYVVLAIAIRGVGSGELLIPWSKFDAFQLLEIIRGTGVQ